MNFESAYRKLVADLGDVLAAKPSLRAHQDLTVLHSTASTMLRAHDARLQALPPQASSET